MKLEPDYLRELMVETEAAIKGPKAHFFVDETEDFRRWYHFNQLFDGKYLLARDASTMSGHRLLVQDLSFSGHQLLAKMRNESVWNKARQKIATVGGEVPIRILEKLLDQGWDALF